MSEPIAFVFLNNGNVVPLPAYTIALDLERRGVRLLIDGPDVLVEGRDVTNADLAELRRWKRHVIAILNYHDQGDDRQLYRRREPRAAAPVTRKAS